MSNILFHEAMGSLELPLVLWLPEPEQADQREAYEGEAYQEDIHYGSLVVTAVKSEFSLEATKIFILSLQSAV